MISDVFHSHFQHDAIKLSKIIFFLLCHKVDIEYSITSEWAAAYNTKNVLTWMNEIVFFFSLFVYNMEKAGKRAHIEFA